MELKAYSAMTHQGPFLEVNEDGYDYDLDNKLFMLFDGFGGSGIGDQCVAHLKEYVKTFFLRVSADRDATMPFYYGQKYLLEGNALINAMMYSHKLICKTNAPLDMSKRGGASGAFAVISDNIVTVAGVGNCMVHLFRKGKIEKVLLEDSYRLLGADKYLSYLATTPMGAFGLFDELNFQMKELRIKGGDKILLSSDGCYARIKDGEIAYLLGKHENDLGKCIEELFELSNSRGNLDNQTALILKF